jgi:branched-chain amino acid transport system ATP-binding protein
METDTLAVHLISKNFSGIHALSDVSLKVSRHEIVGLIGPNGSGKTTLVNIISGFITPDSGQIMVNGVDTTGWQPYRICRQGISRTFQTGHLFRSLSVRENVEIGVGMAFKRRIDQHVQNFLERLDLVSWAEKNAASLPYGIQRRLEIARALGTCPNFILLDEPAAGLNEEESDALMRVIRAVHQDAEIGCGVLIIDHDLRMILRLCDRVHVLNEGKTIAEGSPQEVRRHPEVIRAYMGSRDIL